MPEKDNFKLTKGHIEVVIKASHIELLKFICSEEDWDFDSKIEKYKNNIAKLSYNSLGTRNSE